MLHLASPHSIYLVCKHFVGEMGIVRTDEHRRSEIESFRRLLLSCAGACKSKEENEIGKCLVINADDDVVQDKVVCVTSGVSYLGIAIVNQLLIRGYNVRIIVDNQGKFLLLTFNYGNLYGVEF